MKEQIYIVIILFVYRLLWGYFFYRFVKEGLIALMLRYPAEAAGGSALGRVLYYIEGRMNLAADPDVRRWLLILLALCAFRLLVSPLIRAGLLHELHQESKGERGLFFFPGMRRYGLPVLIFSAAELLLLLLPFYWTGPRLYEKLLSGFFDYTAWLRLLPFAAGWLLYAFFVKLSVLHMQFGYTSGQGMFVSLLRLWLHLIPAAGTALMLGAGNAATGLLCALASWLLPGFPALLLRQLAPLPSLYFGMWNIAAQYHLWQKIASKSDS